MELIGYPETSVRNYHYTLRNIPAKRNLISFAAEACAITQCYLTQQDQDQHSTQYDITYNKTINIFPTCFGQTWPSSGQQSYISCNAEKPLHFDYD